MIGIYKIYNSITNKSYIGQSVNIERRWIDHKARSLYKDSREYNSPLHQSIRKYGLKYFTLEVIEECSVELLNEREQYWIKKLDSLTPNGYNILEGGGQRQFFQTPNLCPMCGKEITKAAKTCIDCSKIIARTVERPDKYELAKLIKDYGFEATARKYGVTGNSIKKWCVTYGLPYLKADIVNWYNQEMGIVVKKPLPSKRPVIQKDKLTGEVINTFESAMAAAKYLNKKTNSHIIEACQGKLKQAYGYKWQYDETN